MTHIIFDLGNVLIRWDAEAAFEGQFADRGALRAWMARIGFDDWNRAQDAGRSFADGLAAARAAHGALAEPLAGYLPRFAETIRHPVPGSWDIAEALAAHGHRLFALTNWAQESWPHAQRCYPRLDDLFEDIVVSGIEGLAKPDPAIFTLLCTRNGLAPGDCLFIDDSAAHVAAAQSLGMDAIRFTDAPALRAALVRRGLA